MHNNICSDEDPGRSDILGFFKADECADLRFYAFLQDYKICQCFEHCCESLRTVFAIISLFITVRLTM